MLPGMHTAQNESAHCAPLEGDRAWQTTSPRPAVKTGTHIALSEDYEVRDWSKKFGVTADELRAAVKAVGNKASDVEAHLQG